MLYALYVCFVSVLTAIAALGHALLLVAVYPGLFGMPQGDMADIGLEPHEGAAPRTPRMA
jgi:hypothetical protein